MIIFDVGANDGSSTIGHVEHSTVFAFEPNPEMIAAIKDKVGSNPNYIVMPYAVSDFNGTAEFNVCTTHDRGCSSLLELSDKGKTEWGGRTDMLPASKITVPVIRLDSLNLLQHLTIIDYFHCDTQGSDLKVLQGLGSHILKVRGGVVEAAAKPDILYKGQNSLEETVVFLSSNGFKILSIQPNDVHGNEVNILFETIK